MERMEFPNTIEELLATWDSERLRITLLNRTGENVYCVITKGTKLQPNLYHDSALLVRAVAGKTTSHATLTSYALFDARFEKKTTPEGYYLVVNHKEIFQQKHILPFLFKTDNLPDFSVEKDLEKRIYENAKQTDAQKISLLEQAGNQNILKVFASYLFGKDASYARVRTIIEQQQISLELQLLAGKSSPSTFITPDKFSEEDMFLSTFFATNKRSVLKKIAKTIMLTYVLAAAPYCFKNQRLKDLQRHYEYKTENDKHIQLGQLTLGHPTSAKGTEKIIELTKHGANFASYASFASAAYLAYATMPQWIGYTALACAGVSGCRMLASLMMSKGRDSSGIISSALDRILSDDD